MPAYVPASRDEEPFARSRRRITIRISKPGNSVDVTVEPAGKGSSIEVIIEDHGPGVPADMLEAMFAPFVRIAGKGSPGTGRGLSSGYGLGLAIAWRAVTAMHGTISAHNAAPHGLAA
ncbi:ATP-binding protein [Pseudochelatococcus contaminans]|uniref:histidine kinase n=1 Tax=Pseudochelatococcus contaminans TaxID=1538103 RepID=A0A7W6EIT3_9HYPH|nr:signal transduction histidine kinase [Pseudochelatococcus contaminans]